MPSTPAPGAVCGPRYFISWLLSSEGFSRSAAITCGTNESSRLDRNVNVSFYVTRPWEIQNGNSRGRIFPYPIARPTLPKKIGGLVHVGSRNHRRG